MPLCHMCGKVEGMSAQRKDPCQETRQVFEVMRGVSHVGVRDVEESTSWSYEEEVLQNTVDGFQV